MTAFRTLDPLWIGAALLVVLIAFASWMFLRSNVPQRAVGGHVPRGSTQVAPAVPMVTIGELQAEYARRQIAWVLERDRVRAEFERLSQLRFPEMQPAELLRHATEAERANLASILGLSTSSPAAIEKAIRKAGSHSFVSLFRNGHVPYLEVARDVADKVGADDGIRKVQPMAATERATVEALFNKRLAAATPEERKAVLSQLGSDGAGLSAAAAPRWFGRCKPEWLRPLHRSLQHARCRHGNTGTDTSVRGLHRNE